MRLNVVSRLFARPDAVAKAAILAPPPAVTGVFRAANDPRVSLSERARLIEREPTLTANLLRLANSAAFFSGHEVKDVGQATVRLGARVIRNIAVTHALTAVRGHANLGGFDEAACWEDSLRRACTALVLAREIGFADPSEVFTVGLIQDMGVLALAMLGHGERLQAVRTQPGHERRRVEIEASGRHHAEHFIALGRSWGLPRDLVEAVSLHHADAPFSTDPRTRRLAEIARVADEVADITQSRAHPEALTRAKAGLSTLASKGRLELARIVDTAAEEMDVQCRDFDVRIGAQPSFASWAEEPIELVTHEMAVHRLERLQTERDELAQRVAVAHAEAERLAQRDPLTGVLGRLSFIDAIAKRLHTAMGSGKSTSLIVVALDHFKRVNARGHQVGDEVLVELARRLAEHVRLTDMVGRLDGDTLGVLLECDRVDGPRIGERLRLVVRRPIVLGSGIELQTTASMGGMTVRGPSSADTMLRLADEAMQLAKAHGRDRVKWSEYS